MLIDADSFSRLKKSLQFDPLLTQHVEVAHAIYMGNKPDADGLEISPKNMPNCKGKRSSPITSTEGAASVNLLTLKGPVNLSVTDVPIMFAISKPTQTTRPHHTASANAAFSLMNFNQAICGFGSGHFHSTCLA
jgi:hypothetical protein